MSWMDGMGAIDGYCHRCGQALFPYHLAKDDFCDACRARPEVQAQLEADRRLSKEAWQASQRR